MELAKVFQVGTDYKDRRGSLDWGTRLSAEVIFLDKTHPGVSPQVFQLKDAFHFPIDAATFESMYTMSSFRDAFLLMGEMLSFDRAKKQIILKDENVVCYHHLIVVSGKKPLLSFNEEEVLSALHALNDALRLKEKINMPSGVMKRLMSPAPPTLQKEEKPLHAHLAPSRQIEHLVHPCISGGGNPQDVTYELDILNRRLYEVQL